MGYIYSKRKLSNSIEGSVVGNFIDCTDTLITYSNTFLSIYYNTYLIYKEDLYEEIISIHKYRIIKENTEKDNLIILFNKCKVSQFEITLSGIKLICIRNLEKYDYDYYTPPLLTLNNNLCFIKINSHFCIIFNPQNENTEFLTFNRIVNEIESEKIEYRIIDDNNQENNKYKCKYNIIEIGDKLNVIENIDEDEEIVEIDREKDFKKEEKGLEEIVEELYVPEYRRVNIIENNYYSINMKNIKDVQIVEEEILILSEDKIYILEYKDTFYLRKIIVTDKNAYKIIADELNYVVLSTTYFYFMVNNQFLRINVLEHLKDRKIELCSMPLFYNKNLVFFEEKIVFRIIMEGRRIRDIKLEDIMIYNSIEYSSEDNHQNKEIRVNMPDIKISSLCRNKNIMFIGSIIDDSYLIKIKECQIKREKNKVPGERIELPSKPEKEFKILKKYNINNIELKYTIIKTFKNNFSVDALFIRHQTFRNMNSNNLKEYKELIGIKDKKVFLNRNYIIFKGKNRVKLTGYNKIFVEEKGVATNNKETSIFSFTRKPNELSESIKDLSFSDIKDTYKILYTLNFPVMHYFSHNEKDYFISQDKILIYSKNNLIKEILVENIKKAFNYNNFMVILTNKVSIYTLDNINDSITLIKEYKSTNCYLNNNLLLIINEYLRIININTLEEQITDKIEFLPKELKLYSTQENISELKLENNNIKENIIEYIFFNIKNRSFIFIITDYNRGIIYECYNNIIVKRYNLTAESIKDISIANNIIFLKGFKSTMIVIEDDGILEKEIIQSVEDIKYYEERYFILMKNNVLIKDKIELEDIYGIKRRGKYIVEDDGYIIIGTYEKYTEENTENTQNMENSGSQIFLENKEEDLIPLYNFYLEIYTPEFKFISEYKFLDFEVICDIKKMKLANKMESGEYIVVCTSIIKGEDRLTRGRILVFAIVDVVADEKDSSLRKKLKLISEEVTRGAVTSCSELRGKICISIGTKIMVYELDVDGLNGIAFHDLSIYTSSVSTIKNYIVASDIHRGITFFYFQKRPVKIHPLSNSEYSPNIILTEYIVEEPKLTILTISEDGNIIHYTYSPHNINSNEGSRLIKRTEINTAIKNLRSVNTPLKLSVDFKDNNKYIKTPILYNKDYIIEIIPSNSYIMLLHNKYMLYHGKSGINLKHNNFIIKNILLDFMNENIIIQEYVCNKIDKHRKEVIMKIQEIINSFI